MSSIKQKNAATRGQTTVTPISSRPMDLLYFVFFCFHIPASLFMDFQALYPHALVPEFIAKLPEPYIQMSNDPLIGAALGYVGTTDNLVWFRSFLTLEAVFQFPTFFLGIRGLLNGSRLIYVLLLIYGASTATTTLPCVAIILATPTTSPATVAQGIVSVTAAQRLLLLSSYVPFMVIPFVMAVDMAIRIAGLIKKGVALELKSKTQ